MDCRNVHLLIHQSLDRPLSAAEQLELAAHFAVCEECAQLNAQLHQLDALLLAELPQVTPPVGLAAAVMSHISPAPIKKSRRMVRPLLYSAGMLVSAACLLVIVGLSGMFNGPSTVGDPSELTIAKLDPDFDPLHRADPQPQPPVDPNAEVEPPDEEDQPPVIDVPKDNPPSTTYVTLPVPAINNEAHGEFGQITLASHEGCNVLNPQVANNIATYYIEFEGAYYQYRVSCDGGEPQYVDVVSGLPGQNGYGKKVEAAEGNYFTAASTLGYQAQLKADGLYIDYKGTVTKVAEVAGGSLLSWSPDGNKLAFSDNQGNLYIYYMDEGLQLTVAAAVRSLCWNGSNSLIYAGEENGLTNLLRITLP